MYSFCEPYHSLSYMLQNLIHYYYPPTYTACSFLPDFQVFLRTCGGSRMLLSKDLNTSLHVVDIG